MANKFDESPAQKAARLKSAVRMKKEMPAYRQQVKGRQMLPDPKTESMMRKAGKLPEYRRATAATRLEENKKKVTMKLTRDNEFMKRGVKIPIKLDTAEKAARSRAMLRIGLGRTGSRSIGKLSERILKEANEVDPKGKQKLTDYAKATIRTPKVTKEARRVALGVTAERGVDRFKDLARGARTKLSILKKAAARGLLSPAALAEEMASRSVSGALQKTSSPGALVKKRQRMKT